MIDHLVTAGTFSLDGQDFDVENNVWIVGDSSDVVVLDAPHSAPAIAEAVARRRVLAIVCTHGHNDHINAALELRGLLDAPIWLHPADLQLWRTVYPSAEPDAGLLDGQEIPVGGVLYEVLHTPGHTPGGCCLYDRAGGVLFSGDTLFKGGPGATGRSWSDFPTIIESIKNRLLVLPPETRVLTGHGDETRIGDEAPHLEEWISRGY